MPIVTHHGKKRICERVGVQKGGINKHLKRIYKHGIKHNETIGDLKKLIDKQYLTHKKINNAKVYGDSVYLFHYDVLITVIKIPQYIMQDLQNYVKEDAYIKYKEYKKQLRKNKIKKE